MFISHFKADRNEVDRFISDFQDIFIPKVLGANNKDDFINSTDTDYVMRRIREKYLGDSTVTLVLLGSCTHSRRYIDWEIKSSLQQGRQEPNGLMAIVLPSQNNKAHFPRRLEANWNQDHNNCYARYWSYPSSPEKLRRWIEDTHSARIDRARLIDNSSPMMGYNAKCSICNEVH